MKKSKLMEQKLH